MYCHQILLDSLMQKKLYTSADGLASHLFIHLFIYFLH